MWNSFVTLPNGKMLIKTFEIRVSCSYLILIKNSDRLKTVLFGGGIRLSTVWPEYVAVIYPAMLSSIFVFRKNKCLNKSIQYFFLSFLLVTLSLFLHYSFM
jgi:hypothetical protein